MMKSEQEKPIVFSNQLMQHIGREVVVNDGDGIPTKGTLRVFPLSCVKFVNEDGSLSDE